MTTYGVTSTGFVKKTLEIIKAELEAEYRTRIGAGVNLQSTSPHGQSVGIHSDREAAVWDLAEACYNARRASSAAGAAQDSLFALNGITRWPATRSQVTLRCAGLAGTVLLAGRIVSINGQAKFRTKAEATIGGGGTVDVAAEAVETGPIVALAGTVTQIESAVSGWSTVTNPADAEEGRNRETDSEFRLRREELLHASGNAACDAIRTRLLRDVPGVVGVSVYENVSNAVDGDGRPPGSIEVLVQGGTDAAVAEAIFASKAAGVETWGTEQITVQDPYSPTGDREINFSRPTELRAYAKIQAHWALPGTADYVDGVTVAWPSPADAELKAAAVAWADANLRIGKTLYSSALANPCFEVGGALAINVLVGIAPNPAGSAVTANARTIVTLASGDITVEWLN